VFTPFIIKKCPNMTLRETCLDGFLQQRPQTPIFLSVFRIVLMSRTTKNPSVGSPNNPYIEDTILLEKQAEKLKAPSMYKVLLLNDDYTPMEFVVMVIQEYFNKDHETATRIMLQVHLVGKGVCGLFTRDVASTKVHQVIELSREAGHPLQCTMEEA
jgi:ATP-dependent Clp protease adaptor protein ClpS